MLKKFFSTQRSPLRATLLLMTLSALTFVFLLFSLQITVKPLWAQNNQLDPNVCYATADETGGVGDDSLISVNRGSGLNPKFIGKTGTNSIESLASIPGQNVLFAMDGAQLVSLNVVSGTATTIGISTTLEGSGANGKIKIDDVDGLTYDVNEKLFYGAVRLDPDNDLLIKISPMSGALVAFANGDTYKVVTVPGSPHPAYKDLDDIAIDPVQGTLYGIWNEGAAGDLIKIDKASAVATTVAAFSVKDMEGLSFFNDGQLYASSGANGDADSNTLYRIDKQTNVPVKVGSLEVGGTGDFEGLTCLTAQAFLAIEKFTNGFDANLPPGPTINVGTAVTWTYVIRNTGAVTVENIVVTDNKLPAGSITCPVFPQANNGLAPGESISCRATGLAVSGQYANIGTVTGEGVPPVGARIPLSSTNPSHYSGTGTPTNSEEEEEPAQPTNRTFLPLARW